MILLAIMIGFIIPIQTAVNTRLSLNLKSPIFSSSISFIIGTIFLGIIVIISKSYVLVLSKTFWNLPIWTWLGGIFGVVALTSNILLFPKIGGMQTVLMPLVGQIIMSSLIDCFGWFDSTVHSFNGLRFLGILISLIGIIIIVTNNKDKKYSKRSSSKGKFKWVILGIVAGACISVQSSINARLGSLLSSTVLPTFISFLLGSIILVIILITANVTGGTKSQITLSIRTVPVWSWSGGLLGAVFVLGNVFLVPQIGIGVSTISILLGQIICGVIIDQLGLFNVQKQRMNITKLFGIILLISSVYLLNI